MAESAPTAAPPASTEPASKPTAAPPAAHDAHARDDDAVVRVEPRIDELRIAEPTPEAPAAVATRDAPGVEATPTAPTPQPQGPAQVEPPTEREEGWPLKAIVWPPWPSEAEPQRSVSIIMQNHNGPCRCASAFHIVADGAV